jgi:hypothetical protein
MNVIETRGDESDLLVEMPLHVERAAWIPGSREGARPGMTDLSAPN